MNPDLKRAEEVPSYKGFDIPYRALYCTAILGGSLAGVQAIWAFADLLNGMMAIPNLLALVFLGAELARGRKLAESVG